MSLRSMARMRAAVDAPEEEFEDGPLEADDDLDDLDELELDELDDEDFAGDEELAGPPSPPRVVIRGDAESVDTVRKELKKAKPALRPRATDRPGGEPKSQALDILISLIPAEAIAVYIAAIGIAATTDSGLARWICLVVVLVLTPGWVLVSYLESREEKGVKLPLFEMVVGSLAFVAWSTAVPEGAWDEIGLPTWVGSLVVVLASAVLYLATRIFAAWSR